MTDLRAHSHILGKFQMAITLQHVNRTPSCLVFGDGDRTAPFPVRTNSRWRPAAILEKFKRPYFSDASSDQLCVWFLGGVFGDGGSNGPISGSVKFKMAAGGHLGKLQTAISQQRIIQFTVCMYADHTLPLVSLIYNDGDSKLRPIS